MKKTACRKSETDHSTAANLKTQLDLLSHPRSAFCHFTYLQLHHPTDPEKDPESWSALPLHLSLRDQPRHKFLQVLFESSSAFVWACRCVSLSLTEIMRTEKVSYKLSHLLCCIRPYGGKMHVTCMLFACLKCMFGKNATVR